MSAKTRNDVFECKWAPVKALLKEMNFRPFMRKEKHGYGSVRYDWWDASDRTRDLLPGLSWECWVIHWRGTVWVLCHGGSRSEALVDEVACRLVEQCGGRPVLDTDRRIFLCPRNMLPWWGEEDYKRIFREAKKEAARAAKIAEPTRTKED